MSSGEQTTIPDQSGNAGNEQRIQPITFEQLIQNLTKLRPQILSLEQQKSGVKPYRNYFFSYRFDDQQHIQPLLVAYFDPPLSAGRVDIGMQAYGVNNALIHRVYADQKTGKPVGDIFRQIPVYNASLEELQDPAFIEDLRELEAKEVLVAHNENEARNLNSFVIDPKLRTKLEEYVQAQGGLVEKYARIREAATNKKSVPGYGHYTYQDIRDYSNRENIFSKKDLEWLETYMKNKGIAIPI